MAYNLKVWALCMALCVFLVYPIVSSLYFLVLGLQYVKKKKINVFSVETI